MMPPRSLPVRARQPARALRARRCASGADAVIIDLEDAVRADATRRAARDCARGNGCTPASERACVVRINAPARAWLATTSRCARMPARGGRDAAEGRAARRPAPAAASRHDAARDRVDRDARSASRNARDARAPPGVQRLAFGSIDLAARPRHRRRRRGRLLALPLAAGAGVAPGRPAGAGRRRQHRDRRRRAAARRHRSARAASASAPSCASIRARWPSCTRPWRRARPRSPGRGAWCEAASASGGAVAVDGTMVDTPVLLRARALLGRRP